MTGEDGESAVELFGENYASEFVGQGYGAEGEQKIGAGTGLGGPSAGWTDGENEGLRAGVAQAAEEGCDVLGRELFAAAVEEYEVRRGAAGLMFEPGEEGVFCGEALNLAGHVPGDALSIVGEEIFRRVSGFDSAGKDGGEDYLQGSGKARVPNDRCIDYDIYGYYSLSNRDRFPGCVRGGRVS
jgi:hypothetical protein